MPTASDIIATRSTMLKGWDPVPSDLPPEVGAGYVRANPEGSRYPYAFQVWRGRALKPWKYFAAMSREKATEAAIRYLADLKESQAIRDGRKAKEREDKAKIAAQFNAPPGTVFVHSWGWEQTNIDFFKVLRVLSRTRVEVVKIGAKETPSHGLHAMAGECVADPDKVVGEPITVTLTGIDRFRVPGTSGYTFGGVAHKWDGKPRYYSCYA